MKNKSLLFYLAISIPLIILLAMSFYPTMTYFFGEEILLETIPVDPTDLFRGDYVVLNYKINVVPFSLFSNEANTKIKNNEHRIDLKLYTLITKQGDFYQVDKVVAERPKDTNYYLEAKLRYGWRSNNVRELEYQIDKFFVPENTGLELEKLARNGQVVAKVKIWRGYALLVEVLPKNYSM